VSVEENQILYTLLSLVEHLFSFLVLRLFVGFVESYPLSMKACHGLMHNVRHRQRRHVSSLQHASTMGQQLQERGFVVTPKRILSAKTCQAVKDRMPSLFRGDFETGVYPDEWHWRYDNMQWDGMQRTSSEPRDSKHKLEHPLRHYYVLTLLIGFDYCFPSEKA
jgi:hypothetical protein